MKQVKILTATGGFTNLESEVNEFLKKHPAATLSWQQSSGKSPGWGLETQLTAILEYDK